MARYLGIFAIGVAIGVSIMLVLGRPITDSDRAMDTVSTSSPTSESLESKAATRSMATQSDGASVDAGPIPEDKKIASASDSTLVDVPVRIPSAYRDLVGPIPPPRLSSAEMHALFEKEPRDEAWAYSMETGINDHIATFGAGEGIVVEYVECRSQYCEIAGFAKEGYEPHFSKTLNDITRSGWWQAAGGTHYINGEADGFDRFVIIISRYGKE